MLRSAGTSADRPLFLGSSAKALDTVLGAACAPHATAVRVGVAVADALRVLDEAGVVAVLNADGTLQGLLWSGERSLPDSLPPIRKGQPSLAESSSLAEAIDRLIKGHARFIPIVRADRRFEGILSDVDVLRWAAGTRGGAGAPGTTRAPVECATASGGAMDPTVDLIRPEAYRKPRPRAVQLVETHISWVFLADDEVYKLKKPVDLGFLDFRTIEQRREACEAEVRLNARLAPAVYAGVVAVHRGPDGRLALAGDGPLVDWAVHMVRLPDAERADVRLSRGDLSVEDVDRIAVRIAAFHASAEGDWREGRFATSEAVERNVSENFAQLQGRIEKYVDAAEAEELLQWQLAVVRGHDDLFRQRIAGGRVRDGHGDLRLEHVYLPAAGEPLVLDCVEFSERLRVADVGADVAFLSMDLAAHGRVDLAERFLATYARESQDFDLYRLVDFYESYRACVRAKLAALVADDDRVAPVARRRAEAEARRYLLLALSAERRPLVSPAVIAIGGLMGSGKSAIADRASLEWSVPVVDSDRTRRFLLRAEPGRSRHEKTGRGAHDPTLSNRVYEEVLRRADQVLTSGRPVIVDASFHSGEARAAARELAGRHYVPFLFVECRADEATTFEPVEEIAPDDHVVLDTVRPIDESFEALRRRLELCPPRLTG